MNIQKMIDFLGKHDPNLDYFIEVLIRMKIVLGNWLTVNECMVLSDILAYDFFECEDGFLINDLHDAGKMTGNKYASAIVSCFDEMPAHNWKWYLEEKHGNKWQKTDRITVHEKLMRKILKKYKMLYIDDLPERYRAYYQSLAEDLPPDHS